MFTDPVPVVPAQHYLMGGIKSDTYGQTSMNNLFAVGETACNGVHGANRLASNSLLESLVFAKRAAKVIADGIDKISLYEKVVDLDGYDKEKLKKENKEIIMNEIKEKMVNSMINGVNLKVNIDDYILSALKEDITR